MESAGAPLLVHKQEEECEKTKWDTFVIEMKKLSSIAMPMVVVSVSHYLLRAVPMMMLGHLDELSLSSAAVANSLTNVTGFSLIVSSSFLLLRPFQFFIPSCFYLLLGFLYM